MTNLKSVLLLAMVMLTTMVRPAPAKEQKSFYVCIDPATDVAD